MTNPVLLLPVLYFFLKFGNFVFSQKRSGLNQHFVPVLFTTPPDQPSSQIILKKEEELIKQKTTNSIEKVKS
jgi:hypothetical protein